MWRSLRRACLPRAAHHPRLWCGRSAACARRACTARELAGSTRAPCSHAHWRPRKLRLRCAATHQQRQAPPTELEDRRSRRASIAPCTDTFAVLCITAAERAVRALAPAAGRGRGAIVRARRRQNGEQRRTRRAADRYSDVPQNLPRSRREPRLGALENRLRVTHTHTHKLCARTSWSRTAHTQSSPAQSPPSDAPQKRAKPCYKYFAKISLPPHTIHQGGLTPLAAACNTPPGLRSADSWLHIGTVARGWSGWFPCLAQ